MSRVKICVSGEDFLSKEQTLLKTSKRCTQKFLKWDQIKAFLAIIIPTYEETVKTDAIASCGFRQAPASTV